MGVDAVNGFNWNSDVEVTAISGEDGSIKTLIGKIEVDGFFFLSFGELNFQPGDIVTVNVGSYSAEHTVRYLGGSHVDEAENNVSGRAAPGSIIMVEAVVDDITNHSYARRNVEADSNGDWSVDFSIPQEDQPHGDVFSITAGTGGAPFIYDSNGNATAARDWWIEHSAD